MLQLGVNLDEINEQGWVTMGSPSYRFVGMKVTAELEFKNVEPWSVNHQLSGTLKFTKAESQWGLKSKGLVFTSANLTEGATSVYSGISLHFVSQGQVGYFEAVLYVSFVGGFDPTIH